MEPSKEPAGAPGGFVLTRESKIAIHRDGSVWHEGEQILHRGLAQGMLRWLAVDAETGRYLLRNSVDWCFITVEDAPLVVRAVRFDTPDVATLKLSDESEEALDPRTLRVDEDDVPYCTVREGTLPARFEQTAAFTLLEHVEGEGALYELVLGRGRYPLPRVPRGDGAAWTTRRSR